MKSAAVALLVATAGMIVVQAQARPDPRLQLQLKQVFPSAATFSAKETDPLPHYKAYVAGARGAQTLAGYAFWTTDLQPIERGYDGPIKMLAGIDLRGHLTGIMVVEHHEPYGDFSIDLPSFASAFRNKNVLDQFKVGSDIDAVSRATITMTSAVRAVRNSSRRIARTFQIGDAFTGVTQPTTR